MRLTAGENIGRQLIKTTNGCWIYIGARDRKGYGRVKFKGKLTLVHRASWEMSNGAIPPKLLVCHKCDTPSCVNPKHLFLGTYADNNNDKIKKGRYKNYNTDKTICVNGHALTKDNVYMIYGSRKCKQCSRDRALAYRHEHLFEVREKQRIAARKKREES
jgi:hypothetical protein